MKSITSSLRVTRISPSGLQSTRTVALWCKLQRGSGFWSITSQDLKMFSSDDGSYETRLNLLHIGF